MNLSFERSQELADNIGRIAVALEKIAIAQETIAAVLTDGVKIGGALNLQDIRRAL